MQYSNDDSSIKTVLTKEGGCILLLSICSRGAFQV